MGFNRSLILIPNICHNLSYLMCKYINVIILFSNKDWTLILTIGLINSLLAKQKVTVILLSFFVDFMQFYLDMQFVILFASQGRYLSRNLHQVIKNIIGRAIEAVAATQIDPYRYVDMVRTTNFRPTEFKHK